MNPGNKNKARRYWFSEKHAGYYLVLPAFIMIFLIAVWPVARSFWISLYDVRLNDPAKSAMHNSYSIDMERYVGTINVLFNVLDNEARSAAGTAKEDIRRIAADVKQLAGKLNEESIVKERYDQVDQLLYDFKPVPDALKYAEIDNQTAVDVRSGLTRIEERLHQLKSQDALKRPDDSIGLVKAFQSSFVEPNFIGLEHYRYFLTDRRMWDSLANTTLFSVFSVSIELVLGLMIALLINQPFKGRGLARAAILIPWATPTAISGMIWSYMYDGQSGIFAKWLTDLGIISDMGMLMSTKSGALFAVIFADVWKTTPFIALLLFAGLQTIPDSLYEAAQVDGATKWQRFFRITLPMLKSTILVALLFRTLDAFRVFDLIYVLTGGGPANSTESISIYAYKTMFAQLNFGAGSALSVIVFLCIAIICMIYVKILGSDIIAKRGG
ncbi:carbohydrate ABC transporter permease [Paenibacillus naphthalenovorans]|uniref:carbohydrate ABC transporter permease n=1 Tax=Paenibacillus naphthalenovorans TaxID=162209 RepID=UPI00088FB9C7|nr:sugar ABC transporter permease [Paenibacillus naphthalenovorans]SDJ86053.1 multiple sugar transport system permease protein [Paenibacillus naphthalenovorans]